MLFSRLVVWLFVGDFDVSLKRMRNAWLVGFVWSALSFIGAVGGIWSLSVDSEDRLSLWVFVLVILEVGLISFLSYGVLRRQRFSGLVLFFYFWFSRIFWLFFGLVGFFSVGEFIRFLVFQVVPAYMFFQGMRGVWSYYYLTHPDYVVGLDGKGSS